MEAEAHIVMGELATRSSPREREQEPQKIELSDKEPEPLKTVIPATMVNEEEGLQFGNSLSSEIGKKW